MTLARRLGSLGSRGVRAALWLGVVTLAACSNPAVAHTEGAHGTEQPPPMSSLASPAVETAGPRVPIAPPSAGGERVVAPATAVVASGGEPVTPAVPDLHIALKGERDALQI